MSIIVCMVTYCTGSARQKREYFKKMRDVVLLDNIEVLFCVSENGRNYFAYGDVPFAAFTAAEYIKYRRALCGDASAKISLAQLGIDENKRLDKLCPAEMRCVMLLEKTNGVIDKPVVVNLDGAKYTRRNARALKKLIDVCGDVFVCVTDDRFLRRAPSDSRRLAFGKKIKRRRPSFYAARLVAKKLNAKRVAVM